ncbi:MAG: putative CoA-substrate-specific enzyme [Planctomycetota bacterium]|nr:MAG: putative CoA-substrate-specific enzyme [Planctomycetota bacterium]
MISAGIDLGSGFSKAVLYRDDGEVLARALAKTRADFDKGARDVLDEALALARLSPSDLAYTCTTGLGRYAVSFRDIQVTEITAAARGAWTLFPKAAFVLDVGAQSTRAIHLRDNGKVKEFHTNEKCAAGGGAFLVRAAKYLEVPLDSLGKLSVEAKGMQPISSVCAVLAESEIINHVSENIPIGDIARGMHESMADRAVGQLRKVGLNGPVTLVGGVALQSGFVEACKRKFGVPLLVPEHPQFAAALGAAVLGMQRAKKRMAEAAAG